METIPGLTISEHNNSKRIINIDIENEIIEKLIFPVGVLSDASYFSRAVVVLFCLFIFFISKRNFVYPTVISAIMMALLSEYL